MAFIKNKIDKKYEDCRRLSKIRVDKDTELDIINIGSDAFAPLQGFLNYKDYTSVVENMHLSTGEPWTIPITLDINKEQRDLCKKSSKLCIQNKEGLTIALFYITDIFKIDKENDILKVYGTRDTKHPGVNREIKRSIWRAGGKL